MKLLEISTLALKHITNTAAEALYLRTGKDFTAPVSIYGLVDDICNYKCRYCECWRLPNYRQEMTIEEWQTALLGLKSFLGSYHIELSGGEPYLKNGFLDLLQFCHEHDILWGVTTNGSAFNSDEVIRRTIAAKPFNVNISIDSNRAEIHDYSRGIDGSLEKITRGLRRLIAARDKANLDFSIIVKAVVHRLNFRHLPELVTWVEKEVGATTVNLQPVDKWSPESKDELWISDPEEIKELMLVSEQLIAMKQAGASILNSVGTLQLWKKHFLGEKAPVDVMPCRIGMRNFFIRPTGDVFLCDFFCTVGNLRTQTAQEIWYGSEAMEIRKQTVSCERLCLFTCLSHKTLMDKVKMGLTLLTGAKKKSLHALQ